MKGLTKRQREIVDYIQEFIGSNRYSPSYREISSHFGFQSVASVSKHVTALKRKGALTAEVGAGRSIALSHAAPGGHSGHALKVPFIGSISAGNPIKTFPQSQQIVIPDTFAHALEKTYALRVEGSSFNEEMISEGDLLIVEARLHAYPGETVLALINGHDMIIKKFYPEGDKVRLLGSHSQHHPIILNNGDIEIQGVLIGLLRQYG